MSDLKFFSGPVFILAKNAIDGGLAWDGSLEDFIDISELNKGAVVIFLTRAAAEYGAKHSLRSGAVVGSFLQPNLLAEFLEFAKSIGSTEIVIRPFKDRRADLIGIDRVLPQLKGCTHW